MNFLNRSKDCLHCKRAVSAKRKGGILHEYFESRGSRSCRSSSGSSVKNGKTEYSTYISVVLGILIFGGILGYLEILIHAFDKLEEDLDLDYAYVAILLKMLGITYVSELVSAICKDAGYQSVALQIEIFARLGIMVLCIPILMTLLEVVRGFLG
mgnify:CR=1 FL=1